MSYKWTFSACNYSKGLATSEIDTIDLAVIAEGQEEACRKVVKIPISPVRTLFSISKVEEL